MKIMVVGGSGFVGKTLLQKLLSLEHEVTNVDLISSNMFHPSLKEAICDIAHFSMTETYDVVINCAATVPISRSRKRFFHSNIEGNEHLLSESYKRGTNHYIYVSSSAVYGIPTDNPITCQSLKSPFEAYGKTKLIAEGSCKSFSGNGMKISIIRPRTIAGRGRMGVFSILFDLILEGGKIPLINQGKNRFQFIDVSDVVEAISMTVEYGVEVEINIGSIDSPMMRDVIQYLISTSGSTATFVNIPKSIMLIFRIFSKFRILPFAPYQLRMYGEEFYFDAREYDRVIPWRPKVTTAEAVLKAFEVYKSERLESSRGLSPHSKGMNSLIVRLWSKF